MRSSGLQQVYVIQNGKEGAIRDSTNDVGYEDEAYPTRAMGDLLRSEGYLVL